MKRLRLGRLLPVMDRVLIALAVIWALILATIWTMGNGKGVSRSQSERIDKVIAAAEEAYRLAGE